ncbi:MAG: hypothetical protein EWV53_04975 [Microcystis panniformis Mp_MB_F_20051200_S9]|uniref:Uncharacterized protein n=1 Tax=Microcystis panniformis Mp_MB_F_20051200_S9 TaxID=2486223 RepID=A0A552Q7D5_9CHRO|nr:MAG: hypothetical protein EWV43_17440 [Microcystis panniformis Mp_MB_F_20080800_S26D]TRV46243.1 MAG: hypothetical protein EWV87_16100 [Microcystis panniformis Mp_GB_SS_20050300_S99]TRV54068.1 MAG: hypothetical protein EWV42_04645 [Microcystis panniformis Mp_GB_SS_20050300_S99D]TRV59944.1 MAG: hypothetical protein EWV69_10705 [Microcystis panniformis Mp_MB_F_20080800_S26]TRV62329.1 MAG: hypothetical protein EWV86_13745 [Microcystis panniformis Mp_MB_F_20051200_S9D]TRV65125.1 MAG: hypothetica
MCDNFCLWNREMLTEKDFYDYFAEETISIGFVSTHKPEEPFVRLGIFLVNYHNFYCFSCLYSSFTLGNYG